MLVPCCPQVRSQGLGTLCPGACTQQEQASFRHAAETQPSLTQRPFKSNTHTQPTQPWMGTEQQALSFERPLS